MTRCDKPEEIAVVINQHGVIICGHQRVRACRVLGITEVPVVVREVASDEEHETLLIEENLRRRQLLPSESFKAVKRLYELNGIDGAGRPKIDGNTATVAELAKNQNKSERTIRTMRTLADLIEPLATMLDHGEITQAVAYQLAQLDAVGQKSMEQTAGNPDSVTQSQAIPCNSCESMADTHGKQGPCPCTTGKVSSRWPVARF